MSSSSPSSVSSSGSLRQASAEDGATVSHAMSNAFHDDPSFAWCIPDPGARNEHLPAFFSVVFDALVKFGYCYCTSDVAAAALWVPPGVEPLAEEDSDLLHGVFESAGAVEAERFTSLVELMNSNHPDQDHYYLWLLGVSTHLQNRGLGSTLLRAGLDVCDQQSFPAYLEATTDQNRRLYERHGFHVTGELTSNGSPPMWAMWRDPKSR
jgi:ribosomal protein S18 acetylase RimI-like enzyme